MNSLESIRSLLKRWWHVTGMSSDIFQTPGTLGNLKLWVFASAQGRSGKPSAAGMHGAPRG